MTRPALLALALFAAAGGSPAARAETTACTPIVSLPATLSTQGVYCLTGDLSAKLESGAGITVGVNNVTIDCNGYKLGNLGASDATTAVGVLALNRLNVTVRGCGIRGYQVGVSLSGGGHLVEDNRLDYNRRIGVSVLGDASTIRRNRIFDTGGGTTNPGTGAINAADGVDILDNNISGVTATPGTSETAYGIFTVSGFGGSIAGNRIRGLVGGGAGLATAIGVAGSDFMSVRGNTLSAADGGGIGIDCQSADSVADGNHIFGFATATDQCTVGPGELHQ
jgi:hypothetical protein